VSHPQTALRRQHEIAEPRSGRDEMNLAEFPFALLSDRVPAETTVLQVGDVVTDAQGRSVTRTWTVAGSEKHGLPVAGDEEVYVALMEVTREQGFESRRVPITRGDLVARMGWHHDGRSYQRIERALDRLMGVTIKAENAFWDNSRRGYVTVSFHILDSYALYDERPSRRDDSRGPRLLQSHIVWNEAIFASFQAGNVKYLDTAFWFSLRSSIARRLYRYLDKKRYDGKEAYRIGLLKLGYDKLGMPRSYYPSHIKQKLKGAHDELLQAGFLEAVEYERGRDGGHLVVYHFPSRPPRRGALPPAAAPTGLAGQLREVGVEAQVAAELLSTYGEDRVRSQLAYLPYRSPQEPAAMLVSAIRADWAPPKAYRMAVATQTAGQVVPEPRSAEPDEAARHETQRRAAEACLHSLSREEKARLERKAHERLTVSHPMVAARPESAAYETIRWQHLHALLTDEGHLGRGGDRDPA